MKRFVKTVATGSLLALGLVWASWTGPVYGAPGDLPALPGRPSPARPRTRAELQSDYLKARNLLHTSTANGSSDVPQLLGRVMALERAIVQTGKDAQEKEKLYANVLADNEPLARQLTFRDGEGREGKATERGEVAALWKGFEDRCNGTTGATTPVSDSAPGSFPTFLSHVQTRSGGTPSHSTGGGTTGGASTSSACTTVREQFYSAIAPTSSTTTPSTTPGTPGSPGGEAKPKTPEEEIKALQDRIAALQGQGKNDPALADMLRRLQEQQQKDRADEARRRAAEDAAKRAAGQGQGSGSGSGGGQQGGGEGGGQGGGDGGGKGGGGQPQHSGNKLKDLASRLGKKDDAGGGGGNSRGASNNNNNGNNNENKDRQNQDFNFDDEDEKPKPVSENKPKQEDPPPTDMGPSQETPQGQPQQPPPPKGDLAGSPLPTPTSSAPMFPPAPSAGTTGPNFNSALTKSGGGGMQPPADGGILFGGPLGMVQGEEEPLRGMSGYQPANINAGVGQGPSGGGGSQANEGDEGDELEGGQSPQNVYASAGAVSGPMVNYVLKKAATEGGPNPVCGQGPDALPGIFCAIRENVDQHGDFCLRPNLDLGICANELVKRLFLPGRLRPGEDVAPRSTRLKEGKV